MDRAFKPWVRLLSFVGGMIGIVLVIGLLHWHFGYPITHCRVLPPGTPEWWCFILASSAGLFAVFWLLAAKSAMCVLRGWSGMRARVERWWTEKPRVGFRSQRTPSRRPVLRVVLLFIGLPTVSWASVVCMINLSCWRNPATSCRLAIAASFSVGAASVIIIQNALAGRLAAGRTSRSALAQAMFTYGAAVCVLLMAPVLITESVLILLVVVPLGILLEKGSGQGGNQSKPDKRVRLN